jgi:anti-anti-sigma factor
MVRTTKESADFAHLSRRDKRGAATEFNRTRNDNIRRIAGLDELEVRFSLQGDLDLSDKSRLAAALGSDTDSQRLTIDLASATFIDASILGVFVHVARRRRAINADRLRIVNVSSHFRRIVSLCKLDDVFDVEDLPARRGKPLFPVEGSLTVTVLP